MNTQEQDMAVLKGCDSEDISDLIFNIENSFGFKFGKRELANTKTFGELCDIISSKMTQGQENDCTAQQAFYKIRQAIAKIQQMEEKSIAPHSDLETLFPRNNRREKISKVEEALGVRLYVLEPKTWINITLTATFLASLIELFFNWKYALAGLGITAVLMNITTRFGKEFAVRTVGELTNKMVRQNYIKSRRNPLTFNREEIAPVISEIFCSNLGLEPSELTREARLL